MYTIIFIVILSAMYLFGKVAQDLESSWHHSYSSARLFKLIVLIIFAALVILFAHYIEPQLGE